MKIVARILLILAAAGAVTGISIALVRSQGARAGMPRREAPAQAQAGGANALPGSASAERRRGDGPGGFEHGGRSPSLFGAGEMLKDVVIIALIVAIVAPLARLLSRRRPSSGNQPDPGPPTGDWGAGIAP